MSAKVIDKPVSVVAAATMTDYAAERARFGWAAARADLDGLPTGQEPAPASDG